MIFNFFNNLTYIEIVFLIIGFVGQGLFASRFIIQWIYSEKKGESYVPVIFWYLSIFGGLGLLSYAIFRKDPVIITGQLFGILIYLRNLFLIYNRKNEYLKLCSLCVQRLQSFTGYFKIRVYKYMIINFKVIYIWTF